MVEMAVMVQRWGLWQEWGAVLMPRAGWQRQWCPWQQHPSQAPEEVCSSVEGSWLSLHCCRGLWGLSWQDPPPLGAA